MCSSYSLEQTELLLLMTGVVGCVHARDDDLAGAGMVLRSRSRGQSPQVVAPTMFLKPGGSGLGSQSPARSGALPAMILRAGSRTRIAASLLSS
jgi:hypothetical protein